MSKNANDGPPVEPREAKLDGDASADVGTAIESIGREQPTLESILSRRRVNYSSSEEIDEYVRSLRAEWAHREL